MVCTGAAMLPCLQTARTTFPNETAGELSTARVFKSSVRDDVPPWYMTSF